MNSFFRGRMAHGAELDVDVLVREADPRVDLEVLVGHEVLDLRLGLRLHRLTLARFKCVETGVRVEDVSPHDAVSFIFGPAWQGFLTTVSWTPFCQLWNLHGPAEIGTEFQVLLVHVLAGNRVRGVGTTSREAS